MESVNDKSLLVIEGDRDLGQLIELRLKLIQQQLSGGDSFRFAVCNSCVKAEEMLRSGTGFSVVLADVPAHADARTKSGVKLFHDMHQEGILKTTLIAFMSHEPEVLKSALRDSLEGSGMTGVELPPVYPSDIGHVISEALNLAGVPAAPMLPDRHKKPWRQSARPAPDNKL